MVFQILIDFVYQSVQESWLFASIIVKYFLVALAVKGFQENVRTGEEIEELLLRYSDELVAAIVVLGITNVFVGLEVQPMVEVFSEVVALLYLGFLFWKF